MIKDIDIRKHILKLSPTQGEKLVEIISNFNNYEDTYVELTHEISKEFSSVDIYKVEKAMENIEEREFIDLDMGKRWIIYNMVDSIFLQNFMKLEKRTSPIKNNFDKYNNTTSEIIDLVAALHPDLDKEKMKKVACDIYKEIFNHRNESDYLTFGEGWLTYNGLSELFLRELMGDIDMQCK